MPIILDQLLKYTIAISKSLFIIKKHYSMHLLDLIRQSIMFTGYEIQIKDGNLAYNMEKLNGKFA